MNTSQSIYKDKGDKPSREEKAAAPAAKPEKSEEKILRVLKTARARLQGTGMPELDVEVDQLITELEKK